MKRYILFLVIPLLIALGSLLPHAVYAQTATPSLTPSPASIEASDDCPPGLPIGWGTYTPSAFWMLECADCVATPTVVDTPHPTLDATVYPTEYAYTATSQALTGTPTVTPTITPTPTYTIELVNYDVNEGYTYSSLISSSLLCEQYTYDTIWCHGSASFEDTTTAYDWWDSMALAYRTDADFVYFQDNNTVEVPSEPLHGVSVTTYNYLDVVHWDDFNNMQFILYGALFEPEFQTGYIDLHQVPEKLYVINYGFQGSWGVEHSILTWNYDVKFSTNPEFDTTPTPTPQPPDDLDICYSIVPNDDDEFGWDLFVPDGELNCDMGWNEFTVGEYTIPAVEICFQPSRFGVITLFGEDYDVGVFGLVAAAAMLWRYFRTSA